MPLGYGFLLGLQASGMVVDYLGRNEQIRLGKMGANLEQAGIEANISEATLQSEDASLQAMRQLRMNLGTQAAMYAARGVGGPMTAISATTSVGNFNSDEKMRRLNSLSQISALKTGAIISKLHEQTNKAQVFGGFARDFFNKVPTSPEAWDKLTEGFSKKNGYGFNIK